MNEAMEESENKENKCIWADASGFCNPNEFKCPYLNAFTKEQSDCEDYASDSPEYFHHFDPD
jgi:hypothetical protein